MHDNGSNPGHIVGFIPPLPSFNLDRLDVAMTEGIKNTAVRPDYSLSQFAKTHLAFGDDWDVFLSL